MLGKAQRMNGTQIQALKEREEVRVSGYPGWENWVEGYARPETAWPMVLTLKIVETINWKEKAKPKNIAELHRCTRCQNAWRIRMFPALHGWEPGMGVSIWRQMPEAEPAKQEQTRMEFEWMSTSVSEWTVSQNRAGMWPGRKILGSNQRKMSGACPALRQNQRGSGSSVACKSTGLDHYFQNPISQNACPRDIIFEYIKIIWGGAIIPWSSNGAL